MGKGEVAVKGAAKKAPGAQFEISIDGTPRTYRDRKAFAIEAAELSSASELSRRYSLFNVGMACIRVWMELHEVCMSSIEQADRRAEGERRAAPDGRGRRPAGRLGGRKRLAKPSGLS